MASAGTNMVHISIFAPALILGMALAIVIIADYYQQHKNGNQPPPSPSQTPGQSINWRDLEFYMAIGVIGFMLMGFFFYRRDQKLYQSQYSNQSYP
jgi:hypothetical protein